MSINPQLPQTTDRIGNNILKGNYCNSSLVHVPLNLVPYIVILRIVFIFNTIINVVLIPIAHSFIGPINVDQYKSTKGVPLLGNLPGRPFSVEFRRAVSIEADRLP